MFSLLAELGYSEVIRSEMAGGSAASDLARPCLLLPPALLSKSRDSWVPFGSLFGKIAIDVHSSPSVRIRKGANHAGLV
jgi:hypothetical protein